MKMNQPTQWQTMSEHNEKRRKFLNISFVTAFTKHNEVFVNLKVYEDSQVVVVVTPPSRISWSSHLNSSTKSIYTPTLVLPLLLLNAFFTD